jgi:hypothetical protein
VSDELREIVARRLEQRAFEVCAGPAYDALHQSVVDRHVDPYTAAEKILNGDAG